MRISGTPDRGTNFGRHEMRKPAPAALRQMRMRYIFVACLALTSFSSASAQDGTNTIDCAAFSKARDGSWYVSKQQTTFAFGPLKSVTFTKRQRIKPKSISFGGADVFEAIEKKCGR